MSNKYIVPTGVLIVTILIIVGGFLIFSPLYQGEDDKRNISNNDSYFEPVVSNAHLPALVVTEAELKPNAKVPFAVGKKYEYKTIAQASFEVADCKEPQEINGHLEIVESTAIYTNMDGSEKLPEGCVMKNMTSTQKANVEFYVKGIERVENEDCYVVSAKIEQETPAGQDTSEKGNMKSYDISSGMMEQQNMTYYYNKETGKMMKIVIKNRNTETTYTKDLANAMLTTQGGNMPFLVFSQWMLSLDENFNWIQTKEDKEWGHKAKIEYKVVCVEKINNKDCFKVEIMTKDKSYLNITTETKMTIWVDKEKRILVKADEREGGSVTAETNLIFES